MEEKIITLNESDYKTKQEVLVKIQEELCFNYSSCNNLDGLRDVLSEVFYPLTFIIVHNLNNGNSNWMQEIYDALKYIASENNNIKVIQISE